MLLALAAPAAAEDGAAVIVEIATVRPGDNLLDMARAHGLGYVEMVAANPGTDPWLPPPGGRVLLPTLHLPPTAEDVPLVVNLGDMRLYHRRPDGEVSSYPIGIGREGSELAPGTLTRVVGKRRNPTWIPPPSVRAEKPDLPTSVPPGPDNPLGEFSLDLGVGLVRIHGTNLPDGVGRRVSHGCIRLYPEDIADLFANVAVGTKVVIVDQPAKLAWMDGELWLEIHPTQAQADAVEDRLPPPPASDLGLARRVAELAGAEATRIDWSLLEWAETTRLGMPVRITRPAAGAPVALGP